MKLSILHEAGYWKVIPGHPGSMVKGKRKRDYFSLLKYGHKDRERWSKAMNFSK